MEIDQEKLFTLLGTLIETNQAVVRQNQTFITFLKERDASIAERTALEVDHLKYVTWLNELERSKVRMEEAVMAELGLTRQAVVTEAVTKQLEAIAESKEWRARRAAKAAEATKLLAEPKAAE